MFVLLFFFLYIQKVKKKKLIWYNSKMCRLIAKSIMYIEVYEEDETWKWKSHDMTKPKTIQANTTFTTLCGCHLFSIPVVAPPPTATVSSPTPPFLTSLSSTVEVTVSFAPPTFLATAWQISQILFQWKKYVNAPII